jgi:plastocyanin
MRRVIADAAAILFSMRRSAILAPAVAVTLAALAVAASPAAAGQRTYTLRTKAATVTGYEVKNKRHRVSHPRVNGFITKMSARVVDRAGKPIPVSRVMLHHVVFHNFGRRRGQFPSTCNPRGEPFFGTGEENQVMELPPGYGYRIRKEDKWTSTWMLMNHQPRLDVGLIEYTMTIDDSPKLIPVRPFWLRTIGCKADPIFNVPGGGARGSTYTQSKTWTVPKSGRIVAGGGHLHGGAKGFALSQQRCGNRRVIDSKPLYGLPDNPVYNVLPVLHEPGPINTAWMMSAAGVPVRKGERMTLTAGYDGELPHTRVMAIMHVYLAPDKKAPRECEPLPADFKHVRLNVPGRDDPPLMEVPLTGRGPDGVARTIDQPPGKLHVAGGGTTINVKNFSYDKKNLSVPLGSTLRWRFRDSALHNITLANGPRGFASRNYRDGGSYHKRLELPGSYRLFCSLHPLKMRQKVIVRP